MESFVNGMCNNFFHCHPVVDGGEGRREEGQRVGWSYGVSEQFFIFKSETHIFIILLIRLQMVFYHFPLVYWLK